MTDAAVMSKNVVIRRNRQVFRTIEKETTPLAEYRRHIVKRGRTVGAGFRRGIGGGLGLDPALHAVTRRVSTTGPTTVGLADMPRFNA
jgi:hypothetical protein